LNTVILSTWTYKNLQVNGSGGRFYPTGALWVNESLALTAGTLDTSSVTISVNNNWVDNGGIFQVRKSSVMFNGTGGSITSGGYPFNIVYIGSITTGGYWTNVDSFTVSTITITSGNNLDIGGLNVTLSSFTNVGTLVLKG